jgi:hypothetical protein
MREEIILIGPMCAGKSSVAIAVARSLSLLNYPIDRIKWYYRFKNGYNLVYGTEVLRTKGFEALLSYSEDFFSVKELRVMLDDFAGGVFDFGASHSYCPDEGRFGELQKLLSNFRNVVLLLPCADVDHSIDVLSERIRRRYTETERSKEIVESYIAMNRKFVCHSSNSALATHTVYTDGKSVEEVAAIVLRLAGYDSTG